MDAASASASQTSAGVRPRRNASLFHRAARLMMTAETVCRSSPELLSVTSPTLATAFPQLALKATIAALEFVLALPTKLGASEQALVSRFLTAAPPAITVECA